LGGDLKPLVIVDYAHKPDALEKVLIALRQQCQGKLYCLFGCGGDRDRGKRPMMAKIAEQYADQVMVTDDNPRHEDPAHIVQDILEGFSEKSRVIVQHDRSKAIRDIIEFAGRGDCVLIAGKGAETYQQVGDEKYPFSDIDKVREALK
jgi:UDP-N-acetylmuramoyl-L-alanyl-D-glutamate--2,6-diaminopimelate ligase